MYSQATSKPTHLAIKGVTMSGFKVKVTGESLNKVGDKDGSKHGKTTGLAVCPYMVLVLAQNEQHKLTDEVLSEMLHAEFPKRSKVKGASGGEGGLQSVSAYRGWYNKVHAKAGNGPHSHSYNEAGEARQAGNATGKAKPAKGKATKATKGKAKPAKAKPKAVKQTEA